MSAIIKESAVISLASGERYGVKPGENGGVSLPIRFEGEKEVKSFIEELKRELRVKVGQSQWDPSSLAVGAGWLKGGAYIRPGNSVVISGSGTFGDDEKLVDKIIWTPTIRKKLGEQWGTDEAETQRRLREAIAPRGEEKL